MDDPQKTWDEYYLNIRNRKLDEASLLWEVMVGDGISDETIYAMDFSHFSDDLESLKRLEAQLQENYETQLSEADEKGYHILNGTTRPYGNELDKEDLLGWVEFMCDVAQSYSCVFSTWSLESPDLDKTWSNKDVESSKYS